MVERRAAITRLHAALQADELQCPVETIYPLAETTTAHQVVETGERTGAILIDVTS